MVDVRRVMFVSLCIFKLFVVCIDLLDDFWFLNVGRYMVMIL